MKPPPRFWWDFDGDDDDVVVQSDWKEGGEIAARSVEPLFVHLCVGKNPEENHHEPQ
jgi:hypothetical protein